MLTGLVLAGVAAAAIGLMPLALAGWRRLMSREGELQIWRAMPQAGVTPPDAADRHGSLARAVRRCVMCPSIEECEDWLASGRRDGLDRFCPNATFFVELKTSKGQPER